MVNFEKQLLNKLPKYYDEGLIDTYSEQRLRAYLTAQTASTGSKFNLIPPSERNRHGGQG